MAVNPYVSFLYFFILQIFEPQKVIGHQAGIPLRISGGVMREPTKELPQLFISQGFCNEWFHITSSLQIAMLAIQSLHTNALLFRRTVAF